MIIPVIVPMNTVGWQLVLTAGTTLGLLVVGGLVCIVGLVLYRLTFHPLARYPGPLLGRVTNLYAAYHAWKGDIHMDIWRCHQKYGNHIRYAPDRLTFNTAQAVMDIYGIGSRVRKSKVYETLVHQAPNTLTLRDKKKHAQRRRIMSQGFSDAAIRSFEPRVLELVQRLCGILQGDLNSNDGKWSKGQDMAKWFDYLTFDIMSALVFSASYDTLRQEKFRPIINAIEESNVRVSVILQAPILTLFRLDKRLFSRSILWRNRFIKFIGRTVSERVKKNSLLKERDVFSYLKSAKDTVTGKTLRIDELGGEAATLIVAGSDTTATTLAATLFFISREPSVYERVTREVRSCFASAEEIHAGTQLNSCRYLRACIDEALRLSPPAGSALWREVEEGGSMIDGCHIPAGYDVAVGVYSIHHNATIYPDPFCFQPDRWLEDGPPGVREAFMPFSLGTRSCIGKGLALVEILLTLSNIIWRFDLEPAEGMEYCQEYTLQDHVTGAKKGPFLKFRPFHRAQGKEDHIWNGVDNRRSMMAAGYV